MYIGKLNVRVEKCFTIQEESDVCEKGLYNFTPQEESGISVKDIDS